MTYLKKPTLTQQQNELRKLIDERINEGESKVRQRIYQWLNDNQYFMDNELFDFYFCVAQNLAAVEVLGGSGEKIVKAKVEEKFAEAYTTQIVDTSNWINEQLDSQLNSVQQNQKKLDTKLVQVMEGLAREHQNLQAVSTGLVNSTSSGSALITTCSINVGTWREYRLQIAYYSLKGIKAIAQLAINFGFYRTIVVKVVDVDC